MSQLVRLSGMADHLQSMVLSGCSSIELLRLATTSRGMHTMAVMELGWRRVDITVTKISDTKCSIEIGENGMKSIVLFDEEYLFDYFWILVLLERYARQVRSLVFKELGGCGELVNNFHCFSADNGVSWNVHVDYLEFPLEQCNSVLLEWFIPRRLKMTTPALFDPYRQGLVDQQGCGYVSRGMQDAEVIELEDRDDPGEGATWFSNTPAIAYLRVLLAPSLHLSAHSRISNEPVFAFVEYWQKGRRSVVEFTSCLRLKGQGNEPSNEVSPDVHVFTLDFLDYIDNSAEIPYPSEHLIPASILDHFTKSIEKHGEWDELPMALEMCRARDDVRLRIVLRPLTQRLVALGIFETVAQ